MSLASQPCRQECAWQATCGLLDGLAVFRCEGCGSEWTRDQAWRPANLDGVVPAEVVAELARTDHAGPRLVPDP